MALGRLGSVSAIHYYNNDNFLQSSLKNRRDSLGWHPGQGGYSSCVPGVRYKTEGLTSSGH